MSSAALFACLLSGCFSTQAADTIWPPKDFEISVEETRVESDAVRVVRRFRVRADGVAVYATSSSSLVDEASKTRLPVYDRVAIYQLVPECTRALSRGLSRIGIAKLDKDQGELGKSEEVGTVVRWQAFQDSRDLQSRGRVHGPMADLLAMVGAHLPDGERFLVPGVAEKGVANVLRGVPLPVSDAAGALGAFQEQLARSPDDPTLLLDAFALASRLNRRELAMQLLQRWKVLTEPQRQAAFADQQPRLTPDVLERLLPHS